MFFDSQFSAESQKWVSGDADDILMKTTNVNLMLLQRKKSGHQGCTIVCTKCRNNPSCRCLEMLTCWWVRDQKTVWSKSLDFNLWGIRILTKFIVDQQRDKAIRSTLVWLKNTKTCSWNISLLITSALQTEVLLYFHFHKLTDVAPPWKQTSAEQLKTLRERACQSEVKEEKKNRQSKKGGGKRQIRGREREWEEWRDKTAHRRGLCRGAGRTPPKAGASELPAVWRASMEPVITLGGGCTEAANILQQQPPRNRQTTLR